MSGSRELPSPDVIRARIAALRKEEGLLRKVLRLSKAMEEAEQARQEREGMHCKSLDINSQGRGRHG
jgi:hypothetical protein